jgi:excisionase family DNA binding protein
MHKLDKVTDGYLSKKNAAAYTDVSERTLDYAVARRESPAFKLTLTGSRPSKVLFRKQDLDSWIHRQRAGADLDASVSEVVAEVPSGRVK